MGWRVPENFGVRLTATTPWQAFSIVLREAVDSGRLQGELSGG